MRPRLNNRSIYLKIIKQFHSKDVLYDCMQHEPGRSGGKLNMGWTTRVSIASIGRDFFLATTFRLALELIKDLGQWVHVSLAERDANHSI
jgi:hypothetical protein